MQAAEEWERNRNPLTNRIRRRGSGRVRPVAGINSEDPEDRSAGAANLPGRTGGPASVTGAGLRVLGCRMDGLGPGHRRNLPFRTGGRPARALRLDAGWGAGSMGAALGPGGSRRIPVETGNLHWPQELDGWTPDPDSDLVVSAARTVPAPWGRMSLAEPVLIIAPADVRRGRAPAPPAAKPSRGIRGPFEQTI